MGLDDLPRDEQAEASPADVVLLHLRELQDTHQLVEESRSRYADLYDFAPIGYCTVDPEGHVKEANLTAARLFALRRNQLIGRQLTSLVEPQDRRALQLHLERVRGTAEAVTSEVSFTTRTGGQRCVVQLVSVKRHDGVLTALIDVSALKALEEKLAHLAYAGDVLAASLDAATTLSVGSHLVVPALAELAFLDLLDDDRRLSRPEVPFADAERQQRFADDVRKATLEPGWVTPQRRCIASGEPMLLEEAAIPRPAVVLVDVQMPVMDGWEFLAERSHDPDLKSIPVVVVSGFRGDKGRADAEAVAYVEKPFRLEQLLDVVDRATATA